MQIRNSTTAAGAPGLKLRQLTDLKNVLKFPDLLVQTQQKRHKVTCGKIVFLFNTDERSLLSREQFGIYFVQRTELRLNLEHMRLSILFQHSLAQPKKNNYHKKISKIFLDINGLEMSIM